METRKPALTIDVPGIGRVAVDGDQGQMHITAELRTQGDLKDLLQGKDLRFDGSVKLPQHPIAKAASSALAAGLGMLATLRKG